MSEQNDTSRLDRQEDRMEDQERRLKNDQPPASLAGRDSTAPARAPGGAEPPTPRLDRQEDRMEDQERRLETGQPPRDVGRNPAPPRTDV
jgi:hypothetical protein